LAPVSSAWTAVAIVGLGTIALKSTGPVLLGGRELPPRLMGLLSVLAPALLAALVVTQAFAPGRHLVLDPRAAGLGAAAVAVLLRAPLLAVIVIAAAATALVRAL
jgi:branched-subunit amino acid transport protein